MPFDYETVDAVRVRKQLWEASLQIVAANVKRTECIIEIGRTLTKVYNAVDSAVFRSWINAEFLWNLPTAYNYMQSFAVFGSCDKAILHRFQPSAVIVLSRKNVTEKMRRAAMKIAARGEVVSFSVAMRIVASKTSVRSDTGRARGANPERIKQAVAYLLRHIDNAKSRLSEIDLVDIETSLKAVVRHIKPSHSSTK